MHALVLVRRPRLLPPTPRPANQLGGRLGHGRRPVAPVRRNRILPVGRLPPRPAQAAQRKRLPSMQLGMSPRPLGRQFEHR
jgi:hypothetical protein